MRTYLLMAGLILASLATVSSAADWPQWRGANRDAKVTGFTPPATWPKELTKKWSVSVGDGVSTPALVGDRVFVFTRQGGDEATACLDAADGKVVWQDKYAAQAVQGPAARQFPGTRSSPAVADGKVCTLGAAGVLSCLDAASGKVLWRKVDFNGAVPEFFASSSPIIVEGLCIAQLGGRNNGGVAAFDLTPATKWRQTGRTRIPSSATTASTSKTRTR